jgi:hypothetical protein
MITDTSMEFINPVLIFIIPIHYVDISNKILVFIYIYFRKLKTMVSDS